VITGCDKSQKPVETGGGILADEMGLGKTLTMLSAMIRTAGKAKEFASSSYHGMNLGTEHSLIPSRATLVVVPSPCRSTIR
jgi:SNF2 family DNA or RNA helicase